MNRCEGHIWQFFRPSESVLRVRCLNCDIEQSSDWWFKAHVPGVMPADDDERIAINRLLIDQGLDHLQATLRREVS